MYEIQLNKEPYQGIITVLKDQQCNISLRSLNGIMYFSLVVAGLGEVCANVKCVDRSPLVRSEYSEFVGDFMFIDTQGEEAPTYEKLGSRFQLIYDENSFKDAENIW